MDDELSILLCTDHFPPSDGGVEVVAGKLVEYLADRGVEITVLTLERAMDHPQSSYPSNVDIVEVDSLNLVGTVGLQSQVSLAAITAFRRLVKERDPDVVHVHNRFFYTSLLAAFWTVFSEGQTPLVTTLHLGSIDEINGLGGSFARICETSLSRFLIHRSNEVIAVSEAVSEQARRLGSSPAHVHTVPNGVDTKTFYPGVKRDRQSILYVGRLVRNKGPQVLIQSLPEVFERFPAASATLVGTGPLQSDLEKQVRKENIAERVSFRGNVRSVATVMRTAGIFCRPSFSEGMPLTLLEALASELPPVVTDVAGVSEVVTNGETGLLVPTKDVHAVESALLTLLADQKRVAAMGQQGRKYVVENHGWESRAETVMGVYKSAVSR